MKVNKFIKMTDSRFIKRRSFKSCGMIHCILLLSDYRTALGFSNGIIKLLDPENNYNCDITIQQEKESIYSLCQLDNGFFVCYSWELTISLYQLHQKTYSLLCTYNQVHSDFTCSIIALSHNRILSTSNDLSVKIWKGEAPYSKTPFIFETELIKPLSSIIEMRNIKFIVGASFNNTIYIWNSENYQIITIVEGLFAQCLLMKDHHTLYFGSWNRLFIFNVHTCKLVKELNVEGISNINSITISKDGNTLIIGCRGMFCYYNLINKHYTISKNELAIRRISSVINIKEHQLIGSYYSNCLDLWEY